MKRILSFAAAWTLVIAMSTTVQAQTYPEQTQTQQTQPGTTPEQQRLDQTRTTETQTETETRTTDTQTMTDDQTLPATASPLPLLGLAGLVAFGAGMLLRRRR